MERLFWGGAARAGNNDVIRPSDLETFALRLFAETAEEASHASHRASDEKSYLWIIASPLGS
jgi:hypothetical protein